jgi:hypothetical protein
MTERWQRELEKLKPLHFLEMPSSVLERVSAGPTRDVGPSRRQRVVAIAVAFSVFAIAGVFAWSVLRPATPGGASLRALGATTDPREVTLPTGITVTSPSNWLLVDAWTLGSEMTAAHALNGEHPASDPVGLPLLQLSNVDLGLGPLCDPSRALPSDAASLYIGYDVKPEADTPAWPVQLEPGDGPCGPGSYARWTTSGNAYIAFASFGADVSDIDRTTLLGAFGGLGFEQVELSGNAGWDWAGYVVANGTSNGTPWNVEARPTPGDGELRMISPTDPNFNSGSLGGLGVPDRGVVGIGFAFPIGTDADLVTFGAITDTAVRVTVGDADGAFVPMPPSFDLSTQVFVGQVLLPAPDFTVTAVVAGYDADGNVVASGPVTAQVRPFPPVEPSPGAFAWCPDMDGVLVAGQEAVAQAGDVALRFAQAYVAGDDATLADLTDPSVPLDATWQIPGSVDKSHYVSTTLGGDLLVQASCGVETADRTVAVHLDDGTSSASLDFTLYLVLRNTGWHVWGSY